MFVCSAFSSLPRHLSKPSLTVCQGPGKQPVLLSASVPRVHHRERCAHLPSMRGETDAAHVLMNWKLVCNSWSPTRSAEMDSHAMQMIKFSRDYLQSVLEEGAGHYFLFCLIFAKCARRWFCADCCAIPFRVHETIDLSHCSFGVAPVFALNPQARVAALAPPCSHWSRSSSTPSSPQQSISRTRLQ